MTTSEELMAQTPQTRHVPSRFAAESLARHARSQQLIEARADDPPLGVAQRAAHRADLPVQRGVTLDLLRVEHAVEHRVRKLQLLEPARALGDQIPSQAHQRLFTRGFGAALVAARSRVRLVVFGLAHARTLAR